MGWQFALLVAHATLGPKSIVLHLIPRVVENVRRRSSAMGSRHQTFAGVRGWQRRRSLLVLEIHEGVGGDDRVRWNLQGLWHPIGR